MKEHNIQNPELMMAKHGKSFHFASQVFSQKVFIRISYLYAFCRFVDDTADEQDAVHALKDLTAIKEKLKSSLKSEQIQIRSDEILVDDLIAKLKSYGIKKEYLDVLVDGALFDVSAQKIQTTKDLLRYCYHVAGVVGLMMCPLIFVRQKMAYAFAIDLGIGMQITNICRDVLEDANNGRAYLPAESLLSLGLDLSALKQKGLAPLALKSIVKKHLDLADIYYKSSFSGLAYIPLRPRFAILFASEIYKAIGHKLRRHDCEVLQGRTYLNTAEKILVSLKSLLKILHPRFWTPGRHKIDLHQDLQGLPEVHS